MAGKKYEFNSKMFSKNPKRNERREISDNQNRRNHLTVAVTWLSRKGTGGGKLTSAERPQGTRGEAPGRRGGDTLGKSRREPGPGGKPTPSAVSRDKQESFHWAWRPELKRLGFRL